MKKLLLALSAVLLLGVACEPGHAPWWVQQEKTISDEDVDEFCRNNLETCKSAHQRIGAAIDKIEPAIASNPSQSNCHPDYEPCLPNKPGDALNCGDIDEADKPVTVIVPGVDPYKLDRDGDGQACDA